MAAAAQCSSLLCSCSRRPCTTRTPLSLFAPSHFLSPFTTTPIRASPKQLKLSTSRVIVPMTNGDLDAKGLLARLVSAEGTIESLKELLSKELPDAQVLQPTPGVPLQIPPRPNLP